MKKFTFLITILLLVGCEKEDQPVNSVYIENALKLNVINEEGEDLLSSDTPGYFRSQDIKTFYRNEEGNFQALYQSNLDNPKFFKIREEDDKNVFVLFPYMESRNSENVTLIEWRQVVVDTIETIHSYTANTVYLEEARLNGELIYVRDNFPTPVYQLVK